MVELICARVYTTPTAFGTPSSGWTGFVRFLDLVQSWNWGIEPLIVELQLDSAMAISVQDEINSNFANLAAQRGSINSPVLFVATEMDTKSAWFGSVDVPTKVVQRLCLLAKQSLHVVRDQLLTGNTNDVSVRSFVVIFKFGGRSHLFLLNRFSNYFPPHSTDTMQSFISIQHK